MENLEKKYYMCLSLLYRNYEKGVVYEEDEIIIQNISRNPKDWELVETKTIKPKCENCKFLIELYKHPQNKIFNGSVNEKSNLYACIVRLDKESEYEGFIFENNQGICELHKKRFD